ncbi:MAG: TolC family protein [Pirellulaceae bacterium]|nr:TolC family protein [Pirellulaceae bacterium]
MASFAAFVSMLVWGPDQNGQVAFGQEWNRPSLVSLSEPVASAIGSPSDNFNKPDSAPSTAQPATFDPTAAEALLKDATWLSHSAQVPLYLPEAQSESDDASLALSDVIASVYRAFPVIEQARLQANVAGGEQISAWGAYDTKLQGYSLSQPIGFYQTNRQGLGAARQLWWGGYLSAGYRLGRGSFQPWYKERETNDGGELSVGIVQPLLQGRAIDPQRVELFQANLRRQSVDPQVQASLLWTALDASNAYWTWLGAGVVLRSQTELLALAEVRGEQLKQLILAKVGKQIDVVVNNQLIAERRGKVVESELKFWQASAKLSLYLRDETGNPLIPSIDWLPNGFSPILELPGNSFEEDYAAALARRPELQLIDFELQQIRWELQLACNQLLPQIDFTIQGSQDTGAPASSLRDKSPFELDAGLVGEVPYQRRKARGKIQSSQGKLAIVEQKRRFQQDKIAIELQSAHAELQTTRETIRQAEAALQASQEALKAYRFAFDKGQVDLVFLNLVEPKVTENQIKLVEQKQQWFYALASKQTALGLDPIEQALKIAPLPPRVDDPNRQQP